MKITRTAPGSRTSARQPIGRRDGALAGGGFVPEVAPAPEPGSGAEITAPTALAALSGVLAVQEVADGLTGRDRSVQRGHDLLDGLNELRLGLIEGRLPAARVRQLASLLETARAAVDDPRLALVLDEIDLRTAVELAKLERARR